MDAELLFFQDCFLVFCHSYSIPYRPTQRSELQLEDYVCAMVVRIVAILYIRYASVLVSQTMATVNETESAT